MTEKTLVICDRCKRTNSLRMNRQMYHISLAAQAPFVDDEKYYINMTICENCANKISDFVYHIKVG